MIPNPASCTARRRLSASVGRHRMGTISSITARWPAPRGQRANPVTAREAWRVISLLELAERSAVDGRRLFCHPLA